MPFPRKIHLQTPLKMIEPRKTALLTVKKTTTTKTERISRQHEWKNVHCMLYKADTSRLRSSMQNICFLRSFLISISAVTLKLISNGQNHIHFWLIQVLKNSMTCYFLTFRSRSSKLEFVYSGVSPVMLRSRKENAHLLVNPIPKLTIVLIWKTPPCLKFGKTSNRAEKNCHKENSESEQRTMHVLIIIWSHRTSASVRFSGNDRSSHSRIRISLDPMSIYYEWASD